MTSTYRSVGHLGIAASISAMRRIVSLGADYLAVVLQIMRTRPIADGKLPQSLNDNPTPRRKTVTF